MLRELHITGLGVIEDLDLEFDPGLNVLTGETGAGKTMITVGLALCLGHRGSATMIRSGVGAARVQARFDAAATGDPGGWAEDGELLLARTVGADGKSAARIGGQLAPISALIELSSHLVEMHGQHQGLKFLSAAAQTEFLDRFAGAEHLARVRSFRDLRGRLVVARARLEELTALSRQRERDIDLLVYQIREIESACVRPGELAGLEAEEARLAHAERLLGYAGLAEDVLSAEGTGVDSVALLRWRPARRVRQTRAMRSRAYPRSRLAPSSAFAGYRFPPEIITLAVRWYLRFGLSYRDVEELLGERGVEVDHVTVYRWVQRFAPEFAEAARARRHVVGDRWHVDETYLRVAGTWRYLFRAIDQFGQVIDVFLSPRRDGNAARRFFAQAIVRSRISPVEVTTDRYRVYPRVLDEMLPAAFHDTEAHANNPLETDHGRLKARLRPMRGLKRDRTTRVVVAGHAFIQNLRRGFYDLGIEAPLTSRLAAAFAELALVI